MSKMEMALTRAKGLRLNLELRKEDIFLIIMGFLLGRVNILGDLTPFGIGFLGSYIIAKRPNILILLSVIIGTFTFQGFGGMGYYLSIILIYGIIVLVEEAKTTSLIKASLMTSIIFITVKGGMMLLSRRIFLYDLILTGFEGIIIFSMTYIFSFSIPIEGFKGIKLNDEKLICSFITLALILAGINDLTILGISIKNIVSVLIILYLGYNQGAFIGGITGIILGLVTYISQPEMPFIISILGVSGLLSGIFKDLGKVGASLGFILGSGIISYYINGLGTSFLTGKELLLSVIIFLFTYNLLEEDLNKLFETTLNTRKELENKRDEIVTYKLSRMEELFNSLATTFKKAYDDLDIYPSMEIYGLIDKIANETCKNCPGYNKCWENNYYHTYYKFFQLIGLMESKSDSIEESLKELEKNCENPKEMRSNIERGVEIFRINNSWKMKLRDNRLLLAEQLEGFGKVVANITEDIYIDSIFDKEMEEILFKELKNNRLDIRELSVANIGSEQIEILLELNPRDNPRENIEKINHIVSKTMGIPMTSEFITNRLDEEIQRFKLIRSNRYSTLTKVASVPSLANNISGDSYTFGEIDNISFAALSDGMGIGKRANKESSTAIELLERLMEAKVDKELTIKTINSVLRAKSSEEIFATLDLSFIDLYTGRLQMIKTGSPATYIKKKDRVVSINAQSLPVGILKEIDFKIYEEYIEDGDIIIMVSDGILDSRRDIDNSDNWIKELIMGINSLNPQVIANRILELSQGYQHGRKDDMTVLATKVWKNILT